AGTWIGGVYKSTDSGEQWQPLMSGLSDYYIPALAVDPFSANIIYAGTASGLFRMNQFSTRVQKKSNKSVEKFRLDQNFPNPFNSQTVIEIAVAKEGNIRCEVFDLLGKQIKILIDKELSPGVYRLVWDGRADNGNLMPSGTYFYRLQAGSYVGSKRMIYIR
ncbi:T9SS type A sorting domain-containing protein, partial [candidate division KSB1 bacterium]|nr:T9SS type A sorting domain-containing protein [candidate division KSB1 bacterium]